MKTEEILSKPYMLEIYRPGSMYDVLVYLGSDTPFMTIQTGDIINPRTLENVVEQLSPRTVLRVLGVEHMIWEGQGIMKHKLCVFTSEAPDSAEERVSTAGKKSVRVGR